MSTADDDAPMSEGLVRMILNTAGFNSPEEVKRIVKEFIILPPIPRALSKQEKDKLERDRKSSRESKRRYRALKRRENDS